MLYRILFGHDYVFDLGLLEYSAMEDIFTKSHSEIFSWIATCLDILVMNEKPSSPERVDPSGSMKNDLPIFLKNTA